MTKTLRIKSWIFSIAVTGMLMRIAYLKRGYFVVGGEILILLTPFILEIIFSMIKEEK